MKRRDFLRNGLVGATALFSGNGLMASNLLSSVSVAEPLMPIWEAAVGGHWDIVKEWLQRDPSLIAITGSATFEGIDYEKLTLLHLVFKLNFSMGVLKFLVSRGADVNAKDDNGTTPLLKAAWDNSDVDVLQYLVSQGADVNTKDVWGYTPLHGAASNSSLEVLQYLISQGGDVKAKDCGGATLLHAAVAVEQGAVEVLQYLISQGVDVEAKGKWGTTLLHKAAIYNKNVEVAKFLVSTGADIHAKDRWDYTPLHHAAGNTNIEVTKFLISQGIDVNAKNYEGKTALDCAVERVAYAVKHVDGSDDEWWQRVIERGRKVIALLRREDFQIMERRLSEIAEELASIDTSATPSEQFRRVFNGTASN